jgi:predicted phage baseplate assembly protein
MRSIRLPMNPLDFEALTQLGRSIIPAAAPQWTDHNTHDPGIMLVELLSWIAEAQMYGVARTRKDERLAFAQLLGLAPRGPLPASGLIWATKVSPAPWVAGYVVDKGTLVTPDLSEPPHYVTTAAIELTTATLSAVYTRFHDGRIADWTAANTQDGATFMPFGTEPERGDRLVLEFDGRLVGHASEDRVLSVGVQIVNDARPSGDEKQGARSTHRRNQLAAALITDEGERSVRIVSDTTDGLLHTGVLLIRIPAGAVGTSERAEISVTSARGGFMRAPRFQQIAPNVLPITQATRVTEQPRFGTGLPDQTYVLQHPGLIFPFTDRPLTVTVHQNNRSETWTRERDFDASSPDHNHYVLDESAGIVRFGNGINGKKVAANASIDIQYTVSAGIRGNQPANLQWKVTGIAGLFGRNLTAIEGGADALGLAELRRLARQRIKTARPLVTSGDLEAAALGFKDLGVTRALELPPPAGCHIRGTRVLLVVGPHEDADAATRIESDEFLAETRSRLAPRLALGQTLEVIPPRYVAVRIHASIVAAPSVDPTDLRDKVWLALRKRLAIVPDETGDGWPFGRDLTSTAIGGWIRKVEGVASVRSVTLSSEPASSSDDVVALGRTSLPILDSASSEITIERSVHRALQSPRSGVKR